MKSYIQALREKVGSGLLLCPSVAAVIVDSDGRVLLQEKASGEGWSLPAGAIEPGETPVDAVIRNAPFILPMSAMKLRLFIAGILILARGFPFAVLKNERQAGF